MGAIER